MEKKNKPKKYPFVGIRIDNETNAKLEKEADSMNTSKSAIIKQAIRQWFYLLRPSDEFERMIIYKNVFGFCLDHLDDAALQDLSHLVMENTYRKDPPNLAKRLFLREYQDITDERIKNAFKEYFLQARGLGRGWYNINKIEYHEEEQSYYVELSHRISKKFSNFLFLNLYEMVRGYTELDVEFFDPFYGDTKLTFFFRIKERQNIPKKKK
jgi:hypothetical protein